MLFQHACEHLHMCQVVDKVMRTISQKSSRFLGNLGILLQNLLGAFRTMKSLNSMYKSLYLPNRKLRNQPSIFKQYSGGVTRIRMIDIHQKHIWPLGKKALEGRVLLRTAVTESKREFEKSVNK